jgi:ETFB lysine methyltransferase
MSEIKSPLLETLRARELAQRFELDATKVSLAGHDYELIHPKSVDDLISEEDFDRDERIPYWANLWPSERALAGLIADQSGYGRKLLELGCGVGLAALVAARAGFEVLATDYYHEAIEFVEVNAHRHGLSVAARMIDWRALPDDLGRYDIVIAGDVLYEKPMTPLIINVLKQTLTATGVAYIADPCRLVARPFVERCNEQGLRARLHLETLIEQPQSLVAVEIYEVRLRE